MRLSKYLNFSGIDENVNKFRSLDVQLVDKETGYKKIVKEIQEKYKPDTDAVSLLEKLNKYLGKSYKGKFKFDFCLNEGTSIDEVRIKRNKNQIKMRFFDVSSELSKMKTHIEKKIKEGEIYE